MDKAVEADTARRIDALEQATVGLALESGSCVRALARLWERVEQGRVDIRDVVRSVEGDREARAAKGALAEAIRFVTLRCGRDVGGAEAAAVIFELPLVRAPLAAIVTDLVESIDSASRLAAGVVRWERRLGLSAGELGHLIALRGVEDAVQCLGLDADDCCNLEREVVGGLRRIRRVEAANGCSLDRLISMASEIAALRAVKAELENRLIEANLRVVVTVAMRYRGYGLPILDLVQEGNIGLLKAVQRYDWRRGGRLMTYAVWWIRQSITRAVANQRRTVRLPVHVDLEIQHIRRAANQLAQALGREPELDEIASHLGIAGERVSSALLSSRPAVSLQSPLGEDEGELIDMLPDPRSPQPLQVAERNDLTCGVRSALKRLPPREQVILRMRFAIGEPREHTLEEVGQHLAISRERVRQIEKRALTRLRTHGPRLDALWAT